MIYMYLFYVIPVIGNTIGVAGFAFVLYSVYIYIMFYSYDIDRELIDKSVKDIYYATKCGHKFALKVIKLIRDNAIKRANNKLIIGCILIMFSFAIPSEKKLYAIYGIGSTIDYIKSNDKTKEIPNKAIDCIYKYLDNYSKNSK